MKRLVESVISKIKREPYHLDEAMTTCDLISIVARRTLSRSSRPSCWSRVSVRPGDSW